MYLSQIAKCICEGLGPGRRISRMLVGWDEAGATAVQQSPEPQAVSSCSSSVCYAQSPLSSVLLGDTVLSPPHPIQAVSALDPPCCIQSLVLRHPVSFWGTQYCLVCMGSSHIINSSEHFSKRFLPCNFLQGGIVLSVNFVKGSCMSNMDSPHSPQGHICPQNISPALPFSLFAVFPVSKKQPFCNVFVPKMSSALPFGLFSASTPFSLLKVCQSQLSIVRSMLRWVKV